MFFYGLCKLFFKPFGKEIHSRFSGLVRGNYLSCRLYFLFYVIVFVFFLNFITSVSFLSFKTRTFSVYAATTASCLWIITGISSWALCFTVARSFCVGTSISSRALCSTVASPFYVSSCCSRDKREYS